jgi:hypothetical protein
MAHTTPSLAGFSFKPKTQTLPNEGGTYESPVLTPPEKPVVSVGNPASPIFNQTQKSNIPPQYINPKTGGLYSPTEFAEMLGNTIPAADIPKFAGDTLTEGPQTTEQLSSTVANLNNARNDIATGTTDPYKIASQSGVAYSPQELSAIEKAYAGIYDPAINTALAKLDMKQKADAKKLEDESWAAKQIFQTNENIRQWRETTGTKSSGGGTTEFTSTQENKGASNAGMDIATFQALDDDIKNYFVNTPSGTDPDTDKSVPMTKIFASYIAKIESGDISPEEVAQLITDSQLPEAVKHYYIDNLPIAPEKKDSWYSKIWGGVKSTFDTLIN